MKVSEFLARLDSFTDHIPLPALQELMRDVEFSSDELNDISYFSEECYQRNLLQRTDNFEVLLLCFEAGQRTPIHDHAGSACGVKVIHGTATETIFEATEDGWLYPTTSNQLGEGGVVGSDDRDTHQLSNLQTDGQRLMTLHVYSPPLGEVGNYSLVDNSVTVVQARTRNERVFAKPR